MPIILATRKQRSVVLWFKTIHKTLSQKRAGEVTQGVDPEFKTHYQKKKKKKKEP
jgi:hypothetical protein